jgi:hypothetical protein
MKRAPNRKPPILLGAITDDPLLNHITFRLVRNRTKRGSGGWGRESVCTRRYLPRQREMTARVLIKFPKGVNYLPPNLINSSAVASANYYLAEEASNLAKQAILTQSTAAVLSQATSHYGLVLTMLE